MFLMSVLQVTSKVVISKVVVTSKEGTLHKATPVAVINTSPPSIVS
jgi:hypothetical protein